MMFAVRHSERSEESPSLNKEAEKLFSEHALALLPLSSSNNISAPLFKQHLIYSSPLRGGGLNLGRGG